MLILFLIAFLNITFSINSVRGVSVNVRAVFRQPNRIPKVLVAPPRLHRRWVAQRSEERVSAELIKSIKQNVTYDDLALKMCKNDDKYTIHGWWPEYREGSWPQWCNKTEFKNFTEDSIKPLLTQMNAYWYACPEWKMKNIDLWTHELNKHGSCITNETIIGYFNKTLIAYQNAISNNWFGCCSKNKNPTQCLIPFSRNINETKWLGYCH